MIPWMRIRNCYPRRAVRRALLPAALAFTAVFPTYAAETPPATDAAAVAAPVERRIVREVAPGVRHEQVLREQTTRPMVAHMLRLKLGQPGWRLQAWLGKDVVLTPDASKGRETTGRLAARTGALAAINGDYFPWSGDPLGLQVTDGEIVSEPNATRSAFGITRDGRVLWGPVRMDATVTIGGRTFPLHGINRNRAADELVLYTPRFGESTHTNASGTELLVEWLNGAAKPGTILSGTVSEIHPGRGNTPIPAEGLVLSGHGAAAKLLQQVNTGDGVAIRINLIGEAGQSWNEVWQAIGGGPRLVKNGEVCVAVGTEGFGASHVNTRHPRTAIGMTAEGELMLVTVDGRQATASGMSLPELAAWMRAEGAVEALNLDGGGSTALTLRQVTVNTPSDGTLRPVANGLLVAVDTPPAEAAAAPEAAELAILPPTETPGAVALAPAPTTNAQPDAAAPLVVPAGSRVRFRAAHRTAAGTWQDLAENSVTWGLEGLIGRLAQDGEFLATRAGTGTVLLSTGTQVARTKVTTVAGPAARLTNVYEPGGAGAGTVRARVVDAYGNAAAKILVRLRFTTAEGEQTVEAVSDAKGEVRMPLPLAQLTPDTPVTVVTEGLAPVAVKLPKPAAPATEAPAATR